MRKLRHCCPTNGVTIKTHTLTYIYIHTQTRHLLVDQFIDGLALHVRFVEYEKYR